MVFNTFFVQWSYKTDLNNYVSKDSMSQINDKSFETKHVSISCLPSPVAYNILAVLYSEPIQGVI